MVRKYERLILLDVTWSFEECFMYGLNAWWFSCFQIVSVVIEIIMSRIIWTEMKAHMDVWIWMSENVK